MKYSVRAVTLAGLLCAGLAACGGSSGAGDADQSSQDLSSPKFAGGFTFPGATGFGGGSCTAVHTPIVFLHGNGDDSSVWSRAASTGGPSVLAALQAAGYNSCELFGLTWLTSSELLTPELIYHDEARANQLRSFLNAVRRYTGKSQVDIVAHSMGVTIALHALEGSGQAAGLRRFVSIAGGLRGLDSCLYAGYANAAVPTCGSQNFFDSQVFGFYPSMNPRMQSGGFRDRPATLTAATFYSIGAGSSDEVLCAGDIAGCNSRLFDARSNVLAQLDLGVGLPTVTLTNGNDDSTGIGHFRSRGNSGPILVKMLGGATCAGTACCSGYAGHCAQ